MADYETEAQGVAIPLLTRAVSTENNKEFRYFVWEC